MTPDMLVSLTILLVVSLAVYVGRRSGAANPVGTGALQRDVSALKGEVSAMQTALKGIGDDLERMPKPADLKVVQTDIAAVRREIEMVIKSGDRTEQAVVRIEQLLLNRALPSNSGGLR